MALSTCPVAGAPNPLLQNQMGEFLGKSLHLLFVDTVKKITFTQDFQHITCFQFQQTFCHKQQVSSTKRLNKKLNPFGLSLSSGI